MTGFDSRRPCSCVGWEKKNLGMSDFCGVKSSSLGLSGKNMDGKHSVDEVWESGDDEPETVEPKRFEFLSCLVIMVNRRRGEAAIGPGDASVLRSLRSFVAELGHGGVKIEHSRRPISHMAIRGFYPLCPLPKFSVCCEDVIKIPRVETYFSEIHPDVLLWQHPNSPWRPVRGFPPSGELGRIVRALIGCHYYISEIVFCYLLPFEIIELISPLFGATNCLHYDSLVYAWSCSVSYSAFTSVPTIRYSRPMLRNAAVTFAIGNHLIAKYEHYKWTIDVLERFHKTFGKTINFLRDASTNPLWLYRADMTCDGRLYFWAKQARYLLRYRRAWECIKRICEFPKLTITRLLTEVRTGTTFDTCLITTRIIEHHIMSILLNDISLDMSEALQAAWGPFPDYHTCYYSDNVFLSQPEVEMLTDGSYGLSLWIRQHQQVPASPSYSPTAPSYSPSESKGASPGLIAVLHKLKTPPREEDEGDVVFQRQLEQARQLSLEDQENIVHVMQEQAEKKKIFVELSETETEEEPILAQSQSLDPDPEFAHLFCHEVLPVDSDDEPLVSPKTSERIEKVKMLRMINEWNGRGTPPTPKTMPRKVRKRVSEAHFIVRMSDL